MVRSCNHACVTARLDTAGVIQRGAVMGVVGQSGGLGSGGSWGSELVKKSLSPRIVGDNHVSEMDFWGGLQFARMMRGM